MTTSEAFKLWRVALEAICATECAWVGAYKNCAEARDNAHEEDFEGTCPKCIAEDALHAWMYRREPLRDDEPVVSAAMEPLFRELALGVQQMTVVLRQLDAIDAALLGPRGAGTP